MPVAWNTILNERVVEDRKWKFFVCSNYSFFCGGVLGHLGWKWHLIQCAICMGAFFVRDLAPKWGSSLTVWMRAWPGGSMASISLHTWVLGESGGARNFRATKLFYSTWCSLVRNIIHRFWMKKVPVIFKSQKMPATPLPTVKTPSYKMVFKNILGKS